MRIRKHLGDLTELKRSIQEIGQLHPVIYSSDGALISGERRLTACKELGIEPLIRVIDFKSSSERLQAEIQENTIRKDFQPSEIFEIYNYYSKRLSRQGKRLRTENGQSERPIETIARLTGYHRDTISKINNIFNYGSEELKYQVDEGKMSIAEANRRIIKDTRIQDKINRLIEVSKTYSNDNIKIHYEDFYEYSKMIDNNSIDLILTDPPYPREYLYLWEQLFDVADRVLKPSKFLITYCGQHNIDKVLKLNNDLLYYWIFNLPFKIPYQVKQKNIITTWKPVLIFQKKPFKLIENSMTDIVMEKEFNYEDRTLHSNNWQQGIEGFEFLIDKFTYPNDLVYDPMTGTGTTAVACQRSKRRFVGCEIDRKYKPIIEGRLSVNE